MDGAGSKICITESGDDGQQEVNFVEGIFAGGRFQYGTTSDFCSNTEQFLDRAGNFTFETFSKRNVSYCRQFKYNNRKKQNCFYVNNSLDLKSSLEKEKVKTANLSLHQIHHL